MEHVFAGAPALQRHEPVADGSCVKLVQAYTKVGWTGRWRQGATVLNNRSIRPGTAIATFEKGRWPIRNGRKHAAFFLRHGIDGFWVIDQYAGRAWVESRFIKVSTAADCAKATYTPSNDAAQFSVILSP